MKASPGLRRAAAIALPLILFGCYTTPGYYGYISETVSKVDGTRQLTMKPFSVGDSPIRIALLKTSRMPADWVVLIVQLEGPHDFNRENRVLFKLDGDTVSFLPYEEPGEVRSGPNDVNVLIYDATAHWSSERYAITMDFLKRLCQAQTVVLRVDLGDEFYEGALQYQAAVSDRNALCSFYDRAMGW